MSTELLRALTTYLPWVTGGLAGAILTLIVNWRTTSRREARLLLRISQVDYSLPENEGFGKLHVSYDGTVYENLSYCTLEIFNKSRMAKLESNPIIFSLGEQSKIVSILQIRTPGVSALPPLEQEDLPQGHHLVKFGSLLPGDSAKLAMLVTGAQQPRASYRGDPGVVVSRAGDINAGRSSTVTRVKIIILLLALGQTSSSLIYPLGSVISFLSSWLLVILGLNLAAPLVDRLFEGWRRISDYLERSHTSPSVSIYGDANTVTVKADRITSPSAKT